MTEKMKNQMSNVLLGGKSMNAPLLREKRRHERLRLFDGEAAVSMKNGTGTIIEMSASGFSAQYHDTGCLAGQECTTDIFVSGCTRLNNLPVKLQWVNDTNSKNQQQGSAATVGVQFQKLTGAQKLQIAALLKWHTEEG